MDWMNCWIFGREAFGGLSVEECYNALDLGLFNDVCWIDLFQAIIFEKGSFLSVF